MNRIRIIVNLKHYAVSTGINAEKFLRRFSGLREREDVRIIFALNPLDLRLAGNFPDLHFISQHVNENPYGAHTGKISIESLMDLGIEGSLLNHSEMRVDRDTVKKTVLRSKDLKFPIIVCCESREEVSEVAGLHPSAIAYEPPELIGGKVSVTSARPEIIRSSVEACRKEGVDLLAGAGIKTGLDVETSIKLGCAGVLLASGVVLADRPEDTLNSLIVNL